MVGRKGQSVSQQVDARVCHSRCKAYIQLGASARKKKKKEKKMENDSRLESQLDNHVEKERSSSVRRQLKSVFLS